MMMMMTMMIIVMMMMMLKMMMMMIDFLRIADHVTLLIDMHIGTRDHPLRRCVVSDDRHGDPEERVRHHYRGHGEAQQEDDLR